MYCPMFVNRFVNPLFKYLTNSHFGFSYKNTSKLFVFVSFLIRKHWLPSANVRKIFVVFSGEKKLGDVNFWYKTSTVKKVFTL